ncbi:MAG: DUF1802 family protein [Planctomycetota bacterium]|nr:MAG: DUF1802 family protein [Planctomycetota bacterium]
MSPAVTLPETHTALKEWAVVCRAIGTGVQTVLLRKGGIAEPGGMFRCEHAAFWLYPTRFHQGAEALTPAGAALLEGLETPASPGLVPIGLYIEVGSVHRITEIPDIIPHLHRQILSLDAVQQRFHYKRPELFVIEIARVTVYPTRFVQETPGMAGCHSWVELPG